MAPAQPDVEASDYYRILGVDRIATEAEIGKAYKKLALKHHPDRNPGDEEAAAEKFKRVAEAYDVLRDAEKRRHYDQFGKDGPRADSGSPGGPGGPGFRATGGGQAMSQEQADAIFKMVFGESGSSSMFSGGPPGAFGGFGGFPKSGSAASGGPRIGMHGRMPDLAAGFSGLGGLGGFGGFPTAAGRSGRSGASHRSRSGRHSSGQRVHSYVLPLNTAVVIHGLNKSPEFNGKTGEVAVWDGGRGRYEVQVGSERLSLKPDNITQVCRVEVCGLEGRPELNGRTGQVRGYDDGRDRYEVLLDGAAAEMALRPGNCVLQPGTRVAVKGLSAVQLNGQRGWIQGIDREAARYTVECQDGRQIKIKYCHVLC